MAADFLVRFCEGRDCMDKQQREYIHHLMLQYSDAMVRLTYRRVGDWHLAEDLVQETFLTACCKSERVCGHKKPVAWLFETLNNLTLRESRRFYHTEVSIEDIAESYELTELPMACHIPMGLSMEKQTHIGCLIRRIFPVKLPLSRRSAPTTETTDWIPLLRCRRSWRNSDRSE